MKGFAVGVACSLLVMIAMFLEAAATASVASGSAQSTSAHSASSGTGPVVQIRNVIYTVSDLNKAAAFYQTVFGFKLRGPIPTPADNPSMNRFVGGEPAKFRSAVLDIPEVPFGLELREFTAIERHGGVHRVQDPGNVMLNIDVTDVDVALTRAKAAGATVVSVGGGVVTRPNPRTGGSTRSVYLRDLDGFIWHLEQFIPEPRKPQRSDQVVLGADSVRVTGSTTNIASFWRPFGVDVQAPTTVPERNRLTNDAKLSATEGYSVAFSDVVIEASSQHLQIQEFTGGERQPFVGRPQDPGTPAISLVVKDMTAALSAAIASHSTVVTRGATPVHVDGADGFTGVAIRGPDGVLLELVSKN